MVTVKIAVHFLVLLSCVGCQPGTPADTRSDTVAKTAAVEHRIEGPSKSDAEERRAARTNEMEGEWQLERYYHVVDEIAYNDDDTGPRVAEIQAWLVGTGDELIGQARQRTGLSIRIDAGTFSEKVSNFDGLMFDASGVQVNDYEPMEGEITESDGFASLHPKGVPEWAKSNATDSPVLRYDDGDTKVSDNLRLVDNFLVRQISVVTDEIYLERVILVYSRVD